LVGRTEGKRPLERPRLSWKYNSRIDLTEVSKEHWMHLAKEWALLNKVMNLRVP
jgi:hypothetical protein